MKATKGWGVLLSLGLSAVAGCGDEDGAGATRVSGASGPAAELPPYDPGPADIALPAAPELPPCLEGDEPQGCAAAPMMLDWTCPPGWASDTVGAGTPWEHDVCDVASPPACEDGSVAFLAEAECRPVGTDCPALFLDEAEVRSLAPSFAGTVRYVAPGGQGDGTAADPFGSVHDALAVAQPGDIVALGVGTYDEAIEADAAVAVVGSCVGGTVLAPTVVATDAATVEILTPGFRLANVRVSGPQAGIFGAVDGGEASVSKVEVFDTSYGGVAQLGSGTLRLDQVVVRGTQPQVGTQELGVGLTVLAGRVDAEQLLVERSHAAGIVVEGPNARLDARDLVVRDTFPQASDATFGDGIYVGEGAVASVERVLSERNRDAAVSVIGASLSVTDAILRDTDVQASDDLYGMGLYVEESEVTVLRLRAGANRVAGVWAASSDVQLTDVRVVGTEGASGFGAIGYGYLFSAAADGLLRRVSSEDNLGAGVLIREAETVVDATDVVSVRTRAGMELDGVGVGYSVSAEGASTVERGWFRDNIGFGVLCDESGVLTMEDVEVSDTEALVSGLRGEGIQAWSGCQLNASRVTLRNNREVGVAVADPGTDAVLHQLLVTDTRPRPLSDLWGMGVEVLHGGRATLSSSVSMRNRYAGVSVWGEGSELGVADVLIRDTRSGDDEKFFGLGAEAVEGGKLTGARVRIERSRAVGLFAEHAGTTVELDDLHVTDTLPGDCALDTASEGWCEEYDPDNGGAAVVWDQARVRLDRFDLGHSRCGGYVAVDGYLELVEGRVHHNDIGLNVRVPSYDMGLLLGPRVRYEANGTNVDSVELKLPEIPGRGDL